MRTLRDYLAHLIGKGPFERELDYIPGVKRMPTKEYLFFQDDGGGDDLVAQQGRILTHPDKKAPATLEGTVFCVQTRITPLGSDMRFFCLKYWKAMEAWRSWIKEVANRRGLLLAEIKDDKFVINDGRSYDLATECIVEFNFGEQGQERLLRWPDQADEKV